MATARVAAIRGEHFTRGLQVEPAPVEAFFFDVETVDPAKEAMERLERRFVEDWEAPAGWKDEEKIGKKRLEDLDKFRERAALLDEAPVAMVGLMFEGETFLLHGLKAQKAKWFGKNGRENRVSIEGFAGEKELMEMVCRLLTKKVTPPDPSRHQEGTRGVGHNIFGFDLGKLRLAMVRNGLPLPEIFRVLHLEDEDRQQFVDTMKLYCRYFGRSGQLFIKQETMLENLGIKPLLKGVATGADVPGLLAAGKVEAVATKLLADLVQVKEAWVRMTGRGR